MCLKLNTKTWGRKSEASATTFIILHIHSHHCCLGQQKPRFQAIATCISHLQQASHLKSKENLGGSRFDGQDATAHRNYIICPSSPYYPLLLSCSSPILSFRVYLPSLSKSVPCTPSTTASFTVASSSIQRIKAQALVLQITLAVCPLASYLTSLRLSFLICKMGINKTHFKML